MDIITIEPQSKADYQLFIDLAKRLKAKFSVANTEKVVTKSVTQKDDFSTFFGIFEDIDSETLIKSIEDARTTKDIDTSWAK